MNILSLDTSTKNFSLAVSKDDKVVASRNVRPNRFLSSSIMPGIQGVLKKAKVPLSKVDGYAVGLGPGSFTSLRVGLSTVKALAFTHKKKVVGISSLDLIAMNVRTEKACDVCTVCDAKRNLVFACLYRRKGDTLKRKSKYLLTDIQSVLKLVRPKTVFVGDGLKLYGGLIKQKTEMVFTGEKQWYPQAKNLALLAHQRFETKKVDNIDTLVPLYLYPEDCQVVRH